MQNLWTWIELLTEDFALEEASNGWDYGAGTSPDG